MRLSLPEFRQRPATHIVSLGPRCATAYNLRRYFGFGDAFPFDWWITPHDGLVGFLGDPDLDTLYDPQRLEAAQERATVRHAELGILLHHEFPRDAAAPGRPVVAGWKALLAQPRRRSAHLLDKLLGLDRAGLRIAFVREAGTCDDTEPIAARLAALFPRAHWTLAAIPIVPVPAGPDWQGDPVLWDQAFRPLALSLERQRVKPFRPTDPDTDSRA